MELSKLERRKRIIDRTSLAYSLVGYGLLLFVDWKISLAVFLIEFSIRIQKKDRYAA